MSNKKQAIILGLIGLLATGYAMYPTENTQERIFRQVSEQTVLLTDVGRVKGGGTGFVINTQSGRKYTLTNAHICRMTSDAMLRAVNSKGAEFKLQILSIAREFDLCILSPVPGLKGLEVSSDLKLGQTIYVVGHPHLLPNTPSSGLYTFQDIISVADPSVQSSEECLNTGGEWAGFQSIFGMVYVCAKLDLADGTNATIFPGNSGSPVTNSDGDVVGVIFAGNGVLGYFVPREHVVKFLSQF